MSSDKVARLHQDFASRIIATDSSSILVEDVVEDSSDHNFLFDGSPAFDEHETRYSPSSRSDPLLLQQLLQMVCNEDNDDKLSDTIC